MTICGAVCPCARLPESVDCKLNTRYALHSFWISLLSYHIHFLSIGSDGEDQYLLVISSTLWCICLGTTSQDQGDECVHCGKLCGSEGVRILETVTKPWTWHRGRHVDLLPVQLSGEGYCSEKILDLIWFHFITFHWRVLHATFLTKHLQYNQNLCTRLV